MALVSSCLRYSTGVEIKARVRERWREEVTMSTVPESVQTGVPIQDAPRLYRSDTHRVMAGICGGLGEYFSVDPVWFRLGFVVLALAGGSGILVYLLMWLLVPRRPDGYVSSGVTPGSVTAGVVIGAVFVFAGAIALINTIAPGLGQYFWPVVLLLGGLALLIGGLNRDNHS
jgi:phage shock protein PspC (stress-responsive transcriptional regulator)